MKNALNWWFNTLTENGRKMFPKPKNKYDILDYYLNPAEHTYLEYGICNF